MSLTILSTDDEHLVDATTTHALRESVATGRAVLLVPTYVQALEAQRVLAREPGLSLSVTTSTPAGWAKERWEVWGDGRVLADGVVLSVLARQTIVEASAQELGPMRLSAGLVSLLATLADQALPWLPLDSHGWALADRCAKAGLTQVETLLVGLAGALGARLSERGYVTRAQTCALLPRALSESRAVVPPIVVTGFTTMSKQEREMLRALAALTAVTLVVPTATSPQGRLAATLVEQLTQDIESSRCDAAFPSDPVVRDEGLQELVRSLYSGEVIEQGTQKPVELLLATGPVAEAELVAARVTELVGADDDHRDGPVVVATPDLERARRELVPKLAARGIHVRTTWHRALFDTAPLQAFLSYARLVARLQELAATWPDPEPGMEGPVPVLGDMSWWPPRELGDFLLSDLAHMDAARAWRLDALWRGNRLLTPAQVLQTLQSERDSSAPVARATAELLRGRLGSAASKLLAPYMATESSRNGAPQEHVAALQAILRIAGTLRELGVTADPTIEGALPLSELVRLAEWAAQGMSMIGREGMGDVQEDAQVLIMGLSEAAALPAAFARALVVMGCTTAEQPIAASDDLASALLERLDIEPVADSMARARATFATLVAMPRRRLILERALNDEEGKEAYPCVMLSELLSSYGIDSNNKPQGLSLPVSLRAETELSSNRAPTGKKARMIAQDAPKPAGCLTGMSRELVFVPQGGRDRPLQNKPVLSASQVETYLECPYKWFSLRRLRLGSVDAGHGAVEMGTFAHRVLEKTHDALLARALGRDEATLDDKELRALGEKHIAEHVDGSRIDAQTLDAARVALELEFDLHREHMYRTKRPRGAQQLLVAHNSFEHAQEEQLKQDLLSCLAFQTRILRGFEPRLFEWGFGRHDDLVEYAGAYFTGTVDRIDVNADGLAVIIDYKHKSPVGFAAEYDALQDGVLEGTRLPNRVQSLIYAQVARRAFAGRLRIAGTVYLSTKAPHALAGAADVDVCDLVFDRVSAKREERVCIPRTPEGNPGMNELLDHTEELVAEQVAHMLAGDVEARPRDRRSCDFCPVMECERRVMR